MCETSPHSDSTPMKEETVRGGELYIIYQGVARL